jgi:hypothetical protein
VLRLTLCHIWVLPPSHFYITFRRIFLFTLIGFEFSGFLIVCQVQGFTNNHINVMSLLHTLSGGSRPLRLLLRQSQLALGIGSTHLANFRSRPCLFSVANPSPMSRRSWNPGACTQVGVCPEVESPPATRPGPTAESLWSSPVFVEGLPERSGPLRSSNIVR